MKKALLFALLCTLLSGFISWHYINKKSSSYSSQFEVIKAALTFELPLTDKQFSQAAQDLRIKAFDEVSAGNYGKALETVVDALKNYPRFFGLQSHLATLLGDYAQEQSSPLKDTMIKRSKEIFAKLLDEVEGQPKKLYYSFKNEYYYRFGLYKEQYENGLQRVADTYGTSDWKDVGCWGYYGQGVGSANYARELLKQGDKQQALEYAQKSIVAWAQFFSYDNTYYNAYVHFALALGILGYKDDMMKALEHAASMIKKDLKYVEFKDVIEFVNNLKN